MFHTRALCVCRHTCPRHTHRHGGTPTHAKTPLGPSTLCVAPGRCVPTQTLAGRQTCSPHICARGPGPEPRPSRSRAAAAWMPSSRPRSPTPCSWPAFCNSYIYFTVIYIGRGFQNTSGLFTELSKDTLSPFQLSLPEGSGTCRLCAGPAVRCASSGPRPS